MLLINVLINVWKNYCLFFNTTTRLLFYKENREAFYLYVSFLRAIIKINRERGQQKELVTQIIRA